MFIQFYNGEQEHGKGVVFEDVSYIDVTVKHGWPYEEGTTVMEIYEHPYKVAQAFKYADPDDDRWYVGPGKEPFESIMIQEG